MLEGYIFKRIGNPLSLSLLTELDFIQICLLTFFPEYRLLKLFLFKHSFCKKRSGPTAILFCRRLHCIFLLVVPFLTSECLVVLCKAFSSFPKVVTYGKNTNKSVLFSF